MYVEGGENFVTKERESELRVRRFSNKYRVGATLWLTSKRIARLSVHVSCFLLGKELLGHKTSKEKALGFSHFRKKCKFSNNTTSLLLIYGGKMKMSCRKLQGMKGIPSSGIWAKLAWYQSLVACG